MISQPASLVRDLVLITVAITGVVGCSSHQSLSDAGRITSPGVARSTLPSDVGGRAVAIAVRQIGVPYRYGGSTPNGFDCSGLVYYSYAQAGKSVPRTTGQLWEGVKPIARHDMRAGDLLFFSMAGKMSHVGMYLGNDEFVHAPSSGKVVSVATLKSDFYEKAFIRAGRPK
jgi:cell wall-associated NlpC family hydrolase